MIDEKLIEAVAIEVDPEAFRMWQELYDYCLKCDDPEDVALDFADKTHGPSKERARTKARAVIPIVLKAAADEATCWQSPLRPGSQERLAGHNEAALAIAQSIKSLGEGM